MKRRKAGVKQGLRESAQDKTPAARPSATLPARLAELEGTPMPPVSGAELLERITTNPEQCGGRPCIRGMGIRVQDVVDLVAAGVSESEILSRYPDFESDDIRACVQYAGSGLLTVEGVRALVNQLPGAKGKRAGKLKAAIMKGWYGRTEALEKVREAAYQQGFDRAAALWGPPPPKPPELAYGARRKKFSASAGSYPDLEDEPAALVKSGPLPDVTPPKLPESGKYVSGEELEKRLAKFVNEDLTKSVKRSPNDTKRTIEAATLQKAVRALLDAFDGITRAEKICIVVDVMSEEAAIWRTGRG